MSVTTRLRSLMKRRHPLALPLTAGYILLRYAKHHKLLTAFALAVVGAALTANYAFHCAAAYHENFPATQIQAQAKELRVTFLNVGKGDAAVVETPDGKILVIDTGDRRAGDEVVIPYLKRRGIGRIDALLLSHPHNDHIGGAIALLKTFAVGVLLENGTEDRQMQKVRDEARSRRVPIRRLRRGDALNGGPNITAKILSPAPDARFDNKNDYSLVVRLQYQNTAFLFTGDAQALAEDSMIHSGQNLKCSILKVAHHGNRNSTTAPFLAKVKPRVAIISVDTQNKFGCPHRETLARLADVGARVLRTDLNGTIVCVVKDNAVTVEQERGR